MTTGRVTWLGPQRLQPTLAAALHTIGLPADAPIATVTAGWQEREDDDRELQEHLSHRATNLALYRRTERVFERDPEFARAVHERQAQLKLLQGLYRIRLVHAMNALRDLLRREGNGPALLEERRLAVDAVRQLDQHHLERVRRTHDAFEEQWRPTTRAALAEELAAVEKIVEKAGVVAIAGGHVAILVNRLRLFAIDRLAARIPVVAWSAGSMAVAETIVLFHDDPPHGAADAEVLEPGLGLAPGLIPFPHARRRLRLDDRLRVLSMARRFTPAVCVPMDEGARVAWDGERWTLPPGSRRLGIEGNVETWADA